MKDHDKGFVHTLGIHTEVLFGFMKNSIPLQGYISDKKT